MLLQGPRCCISQKKKFKVAIINTFGELKESMSKEVVEGMTISHQVEGINKI